MSRPAETERSTSPGRFTMDKGKNEEELRRGRGRDGECGGSDGGKKGEAQAAFKYTIFPDNLRSTDGID